MTRREFNQTATLAGGLWAAAGILYLVSEAVAAAAFTPAYSYARNYISDLGVPTCGAIFDGRPVCSPLHLVMNAGFVLQGLCFVGAALAMMRVLSAPSRFALLTCAGLDAIGLVLLGFFPETAATAGLHTLGALLAIVFGNATALASAFAFRELGLPPIHRAASFVLPAVAAVAFTMLMVARGSHAPAYLPDGIWERLSVYTITAWELLTAFCFIRWARDPR